MHETTGRIVGAMAMAIVTGGAASVTPSAPPGGHGSAGSIVINEIRIDQPAGDVDEYFELSGPANAPLVDLTYVAIGDGAGGSGVIEAVVDLDGLALDAEGYFVAAEGTFTLGEADLVVTLDFENSDNVTHLLVAGFTGQRGDDLDVDDDGTLDQEPWYVLLDLIAVIEEENPPSGTEYHYGPPVIGPDVDRAPQHVFRCAPNGFWTIGDPDPGVTDTPGIENGPCPMDCNGNGIPDPTEVEMRPDQDCNGNGVPDECDLEEGVLSDDNGNGFPDECEVDAPAVRINEIRVDQPSPDDEDEYFELAGDLLASLDGVRYLVIGDGDGGSGVIEAIVPLDGQNIPFNGLFLVVEDTYTLGSLFDADLILSGEDNELNFENEHNVTHVLVANFFGYVGLDLDEDDDGILETPPWLDVLDAVGLTGPRSPCPQDIDGSGAIDFGDIIALLTAWGPCSDCPEDLDGNGVVEFADILEILVAWGPCPVRPGADPVFTYGGQLGFEDVGPDDDDVPFHVWRCTPEAEWRIGLRDPRGNGTFDTPAAPNPACK